MIRFDASGFLRGMQQQIEQIASVVDEKSLREIGFSGAKLIRDEAKQNASRLPLHIRSGTLTDSIIVKRLEEDSDTDRRQFYLVTVRKGAYAGSDAFYWRFVEFGHRFVPQKPKRRTWDDHRIAAQVEYGTASAPAYPFMRPAIESHRDEAIAAMKATLKRIVQEKFR